MTLGTRTGARTGGRRLGRCARRADGGPRPAGGAPLGHGLVYAVDLAIAPDMQETFVPPNAVMGTPELT